VQGSFSKIEDVDGPGLLSAVSEKRTDRRAKAPSREAGAGLPPIIPEGMRALSVKVNEVIGVAGFVAPGTRVDVIATIRGQGTTVRACLAWS